MPDPQTAGGIDHSAISVADPARSIAFYTDRLGLAVQARQVNAGPAQDALDNLDNATVDVIALAPQSPAPHLKILGYRSPQRSGALQVRSNDIAASRLIFTIRQSAGQNGATRVMDGNRVQLIHDPDGHALLLEEPA